MTAIHFEKAFDTLDFQFLIRTLHKFNYGPSFIQWMCVLYKSASSCVMNNGFTTGPFPLGRGVRQGDPLSPYLFIVALETQAIKIREDCNVQGLKIGEEMIKLSLFADDMTCVYSAISSLFFFQLVFVVLKWAFSDPISYLFHRIYSEFVSHNLAVLRFAKRCQPVMAIAGFV